MDSLSDSSRCELDSVTSSDSMHLFADEFHLRHLSSPDVSNPELSKRVASLELENERLRVDAESWKIDANARHASNQALKKKIAELFVEAQASLQEKQKLENELKDANGKLSASENSSKWYREKLHDSQANEKARQMEIDTYQGILRQRQQNLAYMNDRCEQFNSKYAELASRYRKRKEELTDEMEGLRAQKERCEFCRNGAEREIASVGSTDLLEYKLETMEKSCEDCRNELRSLEERLRNSEISRNCLETGLSKYRWLMSSMEENVEKLEAQTKVDENKLGDIEAELKKLRDENERLKISVLASKRERIQVEEAIVHLQSQLEKMIAHHKLLKSRNFEAEKKLTAMQDLQNENKRLKSLSYAANSSLLKKLKEEKRRVKHLEIQLRLEKTKNRQRVEHAQRDKTMSSMRECLRRALERNEELKERLKTKISDESIDEGYGDGSIVVSGTTELPSSPHLDSVLIKSAVEVLSRSKNLMAPLESSIERLRLKMEKLTNNPYSNFDKSMNFQYYDIRLEEPASLPKNLRPLT